jgi:hypothetical protein
MGKPNQQHMLVALAAARDCWHHAPSTGADPLKVRAHGADIALVYTPKRYYSTS